MLVIIRSSTLFPLVGRAFICDRKKSFNNSENSFPIELSVSSTVLRHLRFVPGREGANGQAMVRALPFEMYQKVCMKLNPRSSLNNDFRILGGLMKYSTVQIKTFEQKENPTDSLLQDWGTRNESTVGKLIEYLEIMNRHDVIDVLNGKDKKPDKAPGTSYVVKTEPHEMGCMALVRDIDYIKRLDICQKLNLPRGTIGGDYEEFASKVGMSPDQIREISRKENPTDEILMWWGAKNEATVQRMKSILLEMGREDVGNML